jgi:membrane protease YdiL (CAAX protease family)
MSLKFSCPHCSYEIISGYLQSGDMLRCPECGNYISVPAKAISTDEPSNIIKYTPTPEDDPISDEKQLPTLPPPEPTEWGISDILKGIIYYLIGLIIITVVLRVFCASVVAIAGIGNDYWPSDWNKPYSTYYSMLENLVLDAYSICILYYIVVKKHHNKFYSALKLNWISFREFVFYFIIGMASYYFPHVIRGGFHLSTLHIQGIIFNTSIKLPYGYFYEIAMSLPPLMAAFFEEVVFRGFIYSGLKKSLGQAWAVIIVTVAFVAVHYGKIIYNPSVLMGHVISAMLLIWIRVKTDSVTKPMVAHFAHNFVIETIIWIHRL